MLHSKYRTQADHRRVRFALHDDYKDKEGKGRWDENNVSKANYGEL